MKQTMRQVMLTHNFIIMSRSFFFQTGKHLCKRLSHLTDAIIDNVPLK